MNSQRANIVSELLNLSHEFGRRGLVILGEGNVSARLSESTFLVKASGTSLGTLIEGNLTECRFDRLLSFFDDIPVSDAEVETALLAGRVNPGALKPSVEVNQILCSSHAREFSRQRQCPDEVVCCGPVSLLIPYVDPGLALAKKIRDELLSFQVQHGKLPRVILLENHGVITVGSSVQAVRAAMLMTVKAAEIYIGAQQLGGIKHLPETEVTRVESRLDEEYRRKMLRI